MNEDDTTQEAQYLNVCLIFNNNLQKKVLYLFFSVYKMTRRDGKNNFLNLKKD